MDSNTLIKIRAEIVGQGVIFPSPFSGAAHFDGRFPPEGYKMTDPFLVTRPEAKTDLTFVPEKGWKCSGGVYLRSINQKAGRTPEYAWGSQFSPDAIRTLKGGDNMPDGSPRFHLSIGPGCVTKLSAGEYILRVVFVPIDSTPPAYTGPTLEEMAGLADLKKVVADIDTRLKVVEAK